MITKILDRRIAQAQEDLESSEDGSKEMYISIGEFYGLRELKKELKKKGLLENKRDNIFGRKEQA